MTDLLSREQVEKALRHPHLTTLETQLGMAYLDLLDLVANIWEEGHFAGLMHDPRNATINPYRTALGGDHEQPTILPTASGIPWWQQVQPEPRDHEQPTPEGKPCMLCGKLNTEHDFGVFCR